ncbi:MAG: stalk domain-containing protein, partial [Candidatus Cryosericum sp.]
DTLTWSISTAASHGAATASGTGSSKSIGYNSTANYNGSDAFVVQVSDGNGGADSLTVNVTISAINDVPSFTKGADQTNAEDCCSQSVTEWATNINAGPSNESGQALNFGVSNDNNALFSVQPAISANGTLTFTPAANANGTATVTVQIHDDGGTANGGVDTSASQTFTVTVTPVNDPPVNTAVPVISGIPHVGRTLATTDGVWNDRIDTDVSGTSVLSYAYQWQRSTDGGTVFVDIPGATAPTYVLTLADNLQTVRSRVMCTDDGVGLPVHQTTSELSTPVSVTILNAAPVITEGPAISTSCDEDESPASFALVLHATDSDIIDTLTWHIVTPPAHGTLTLRASSMGSSTVPSFYHPAANWNGTDTFTLQIEDGLTGTDEITVTVTVIPRSDAPINTLRPSIAGNLFVNHEVRAVNGTWNDHIDTDISGTSVLSYTYQWLRARDAAGTELVLIPGATASTYVVSAIDEGKYLAVRVTCTDNGVGLPATMSTTVDSAFLRARNIDVMSPVITLPDFSSWPGVTGWSGVPVQTFVVNSSPFALQFTLEDNSGSAKWSIKVNGVVIVDPIGADLITYSLPLAEGRNNVEISASDASGNASSVKLVIYLVTMNGTTVIPFLDGSFHETLTLTRGINTIVIEAEDKAGHTTSVTTTVTYATTVQPLPATVITLAIGKTQMSVGGRTVALDTAPVIKQGRTMLPIRAIAEAVNASVAWDPVARKVTITRGATRIELWIGKSTAKLNGKAVPIDAANNKVIPCITSGRTMLPVRFISEMLGLDVHWNASTQVVTLTLEP